MLVNKLVNSAQLNQARLVAMGFARSFAYRGSPVLTNSAAAISGMYIHGALLSTVKSRLADCRSAA